MTFEPFVSAEKAAEFLGIRRRFLLSLARQGIAGAYAIGTGEQRHTWVFKLSELSQAINPTQKAELRRPPHHEPRYDREIRRSPLK